MALFDQKVPVIRTSTVSGLFINPRWVTTAVVSFVRPVVSQNSAGELVTTMNSAATLVVDLQPRGGGYVRLLHGKMEQIAMTAVIAGNPDLLAGDRTTVSGMALEVVDIQRFGTHQAEVDLRDMGR